MPHMEEIPSISYEEDSIIQANRIIKGAEELYAMKDDHGQNQTTELLKPFQDNSFSYNGGPIEVDNPYEN